MSTALLLIPDFALILFGFLLNRITDWGRDFWSGLEKLIYYVLFPALLFNSIARTHIDFTTATPALETAAIRLDSERAAERFSPCSSDRLDEDTDGTSEPMQPIKKDATIVIQGDCETASPMALRHIPKRASQRTVPPPRRFTNRCPASPVRIMPEANALNSRLVTV